MKRKMETVSKQDARTEREPTQAQAAYVAMLRRSAARLHAAGWTEQAREKTDRADLIAQRCGVESLTAGADK